MFDKMPKKECIPRDVLNNETIHLLLQFIHIRNSIKAVEWEIFFFSCCQEPKLLPLYWYTPGVFRCFNLLAGILFSFAEVRLFNSQLLIAIRGCGVNCLHHEHPGNYDVCLSFRGEDKTPALQELFRSPLVHFE